MKLKNTADRKSNLWIFIVLGLGLIGLVSLKLIGGFGDAVSDVKSVHSLEKRNYVDKAHDYTSIIKNGINRVYNDSVLSIHINRNLGIPFISYVYKDELVGRQRTDNFYLHFFLDDATQLQQRRQVNFLNMDFRPSPPLELEIDGQKYYVFKRIIDDEFMDFDNIKQVNTGRINTTNNSKSMDLRNIQVRGLEAQEVSSGFKKLSIEVSQKSFEKIKAKRETARQNNVLITRDEDLVNARVTFGEVRRAKAKTRLKGDWTDHLAHQTKWSYRIIMDGDETIKGMRKFSVQHPKSRHYIWEWMFNKIIKENDLIGLRYDFVDVDILITSKDQIVETVPMGIMAMEESFDKILIENNKRREGVILAFDESYMWEDREQQFKMGLTEESRSGKLESIKNAPIKVFNENKVLSDPNLSKQFAIAKDLLEGVRNGSLKVSEAFDLDKLTDFVAISNLFDANHGMVPHNLRIYFNPITGKLEPISFDSYSGRQLTQITHYPFTSMDHKYRTMVLEKFEKFTRPEFLNDFLDRHYDEINNLYLNMSSEFTFPFDLTSLEYNSNFIKKAINPSNAVISSLVEQTETTMTVQVKNLAGYPIIVKNLKHKDGKKLNKNALNALLGSEQAFDLTFDLDEAFTNAFVSKKNKVGAFRYPKDVEKLRVTYHVLGIDYMKSMAVSPYPNGLKDDKSLCIVS